MTETKMSKISAFHLYGEYRCYLTAEAWVITYNDADLIRIFRNTNHKPGFLLLFVEIIMMLLIGKRTALRDAYAIWPEEYENEAHEIGIEVKAAQNRVMEVEFKNREPKH